MRVLVTGIGGFAGPTVAAALLAAGHEVHGVLHAEGRTPPRPNARLAALPLAPAALRAGELSERAFVERLVAEVAPEAIVHLAALSFVPAAERDPERAYRANVQGTLNVLAAVRAAAPRARLLAVTSGDIYGAVQASELPIDEETPLRPLSVYGASKAAADVAAGQWSRAYGLDVVRARPFNHSGPGQDAAFVCSALARQIAAIEAGRQPAIVRAGNLDPVRDFSDVRDIAAGYVALLARGRTGEAYNLCSGEGVSIAEVVALLRSHARVPVRVHSDPALRRANDVPRIVGSYARAARETGWQPRIPLADTLAALLADWRVRIAAEPENG
jgi:GDP-4-dehydro-6-deoxy-D-mannose reductase